MPDWEDKVDPHFDFQADTFAPDRNVSDDIYAHEVFNPPPYDGILLSRGVVEKTNYEALRTSGAHAYLRLRKGMEVFGDCGAFSYVNEPEPWYETEDVLNYYAAIGVDYGASVDHLVVNSIYTTETVTELKDGTAVTTVKKQKQRMSEDECRRRVEITLDNAEEFLRLHQHCKYEFTPVGVAQGWTPETYAESVRRLLRFGYTYIALGGLARSSASQVRDVLIAVNRVVDRFWKLKSSVRFHLFGVAKLTLVGELPAYRVASIDSASYLRKAWLRSGQNYLGADGQWYTAIRVPQSDNPKVREYVSHNGKSLYKVEEQEHSCLQLLQEYGARKLPENRLDDLLNELVEYDTYLLRIGDDGQELRDIAISKDRYQRTLLARPWEQCQCEVCKRLGIHVLIFRGTNRNKRRGFHNTWTFYQRLRGLSVGETRPEP